MENILLLSMLFKRSSYSKVPDEIKLGGNFNSFKKELKSFLLKHSSYSVDEFISSEF
jgi:hypothetical protein